MYLTGVPFCSHATKFVHGPLAFLQLRTIRRMKKWSWSWTASAAACRNLPIWTIFSCELSKLFGTMRLEWMTARSIYQGCRCGALCQRPQFWLRASTLEPGDFHLGALQLLMRADVCTEIVFVFVSSMPSCASNTSCGSDRIRRATLLGQSAVQFQRVRCSILKKFEGRRHSTTLCQNEGNHFEDTSVII